MPPPRRRSLPISQALPEPSARPHRPMIVVVAEEEFLVLSWTGSGTMWVFLNTNRTRHSAVALPPTLHLFIAPYIYPHLMCCRF
ncbi:hypothetical protein EDB87DRAFT_1133032 [Lactarius vividus]|nr:hypothetical protein EDB87DRAFT_1133032 [Lactarius vividus]